MTSPVASNMKICLIGAGSFVFGPTVLHDVIVEHRLDGAHLALVDPRLEMAELMAGLGRRMAATSDVRVQTSAHRDWQEALAGADFVICCAAVQLQRRFAMDVEIIRKHYPKHLITEFGGVQGISSSLRQIAMIRKLALEMRRLCPKAWLLSSANPLPRVCQAAHHLGVHTAGFCSNSMGGHNLIGRVLHAWAEDYPWPQAVARYEAVMAGINHFTFALELRERASGRELLAEFIARARQQNGFEPRTEELVQETGCWPANGDEHMRDFLPPNAASHSLELTSHGTAAEREARLAELQAAADGRGPWKPLLAHRAWEKPVDFAVALSGGRAATFHSLNLVNAGQLPELPAGVFVETPVVVDSQGVHPRRLRLPEAVVRLSRPQAEINDLIVRAALNGQVNLLDAALELDPTVLDKAAARRALTACREAHVDLLAD
jgi:alpha-galactosidase